MSENSTLQTHAFPRLEPASLPDTRNALTAWSRVIGDLLKRCRPRRRHWWHASLRPSVRGLTTGPIRATVDFEVELDLMASRARLQAPGGDASMDLSGQPADELSTWLEEALLQIGVAIPGSPGAATSRQNRLAGYDAGQATTIHAAFAAVAAAMEKFRATLRQEASPIQVWPHHFDLSMIWLPGTKIPGQDPADEEAADKQMNFGFALGDEGIAEPYFYVTAYPMPAALRDVALPAGAHWQSTGFDGVVMLYRDLAAVDDPTEHLVGLWKTLLAAAGPILMSETQNG